MPSSYTTSARFTLQATGENNNTWGVILNSGVFQLVDDNVNGRLAFALSGAKALTSNLGATDEARMAFLDVTGGTGGTVTIPSVTKGYFVRNATAGNVAISAGGTAATFLPGDAGPTFSDGSNVYPVLIGGKTIRGYIETIVPAGPPMAGQAGKFLGNDGVNTALWQTSTPLTWSFGGVVVNKGATAPPAPIDASVGVQVTGATGLGPRLEMNGFASASQYNARRANGTAAAPTALAANDPMLVIGGRGYGATGWAGTNRAAINLTAAENWTDAAQGARLDFVTTPNGGALSALRWSMVDAGHLIPATANTYDIGSGELPIRGLAAAGLVTINRSGLPTPAPIDAGTGVLVVGPPGFASVVEAVGFSNVGRFSGRRANGTPAAPTAVLTGQNLTTFAAWGYGATAWGTLPNAQVFMSATENWTDTAHGTSIRFQTTPNGTNAPTVRWDVAHDGHFVPVGASLYDIGSPTNPVRNIYTGGALTTTQMVVINLGPTAPPAPIDAGVGLQITGATGVTPRVEINGIGNTPQYNGRRANGTAAAPTAVLNNEPLLVLGARGYGATGWAASNRVAINLTASENWTDAAQGTRLDFVTTPIGTNVSALRWSIVDGGHLIPAAANTYDIGSAALPVRSGYFSAPVSVNQSGVAAPAVLNAGTVFQGVAVQGTTPTMELIGFGSLARYAGRSANGTPAAPMPTLANDALVSLAGYGRQTSGWASGASAQVFVAATENWTDTAHGTCVRFTTTSNLSVSAATRWEIGQDGHFVPGAANTYDVGSAALPVRDIYASTVTERYKVSAINAATFLSDIPSNSQANIGAGGSLRANSNAQVPIVAGHHIAVLNFSGAAITITQEPAAVLYWVNPAGAVQTGNRTIANGAYVTIVSIGTSWAISGTGIT